MHGVYVFSVRSEKLLGGFLWNKTNLGVFSHAHLQPVVIFASIVM